MKAHSAPQRCAADFGQCVEHRLKMKGRTAHECFQHLGGRGVLLKRFVQLMTEARDLRPASRSRTELRKTALGPLRPFTVNALRGRALAGLPPALERLFHWLARTLPARLDRADAEVGRPSADAFPSASLERHRERQACHLAVLEPSAP